MNQPSVPATETMTFVLRFWREWTGTEARWRGRIEHVQSGQQVSFLAIGDLLNFLGRFGIPINEPFMPFSDSERRPES